MNSTKNLEDLLNKGIESGDLQGTMDLFLNMLDEQDEDPKICFYVGLLLVRMKNYQSGIRYLEMAKNADLDPGQKLRCLVFLGKAYADVKAFSKAERSFREALQTGVPEPGAYSALGAVFYERNMVEQAIDALEKSLEIDPNYAGALNNLGYIYIETKRNMTEGLSMCRRAVELDPENPAYRDSLAKAYMLTNQLQEAFEQIEIAAKKVPDNLIISNRLKEIRKKMGA